MKNLDKNPPYNLPTYPPTWLDTDSNGSALWVVYDAREGFQPAYALVFADTAEDAVEVSRAIAYPSVTEHDANGDIVTPSRLDPESETLQCVKVREVGAIEDGSS